MHSYTTQSFLVQNTVQNPQKVMLSFCEFLDFSMSQIGPLAGPGSSLQVICLTPQLTNVSLELCYRALIRFSKAFLLQCHQRHTVFDNYIVCSEKWQPDPPTSGFYLLIYTSIKRRVCRLLLPHSVSACLKLILLVVKSVCLKTLKGQRVFNQHIMQIIC